MKTDYWVARWGGPAQALAIGSPRRSQGWLALPIPPGSNGPTAGQGWAQRGCCWHLWRKEGWNTREDWGETQCEKQQAGGLAAAQGQPTTQAPSVFASLDMVIQKKNKSPKKSRRIQAQPISITKHRSPRATTFSAGACALGLFEWRCKLENKQKKSLEWSNLQPKWQEAKEEDFGFSASWRIREW